MNLKEIGRRIANQRKLKGMTQEMLAEKAEISYAKYSKCFRDVFRLYAFK